MSGVTVYSLSGPEVTERGPAYMGPQWRELFRHTLKEADRLGLGVSTMLCSGWNAGGPWIKPEHACKRHVSAERVIRGPQHFKGPLPQPPADRRFYRDVAVQAFRVASAKARPVISASSSHHNYPIEDAADGDMTTFWVSNGEGFHKGPAKDRPEWVQLDLGEKQTVKRLTIIPRPGYGPRDAQLQVSDDGTSFKTVKTLALDKNQPMEVALPETPVRIVRLSITSTWDPRMPTVQIIEFAVEGAERAAAAVAPADVVDLTAQFGRDGTLDWDVPAGQWIVVRTGYTISGSMTTWSSPTGVGLEADPLDAAAMDLQFAHAGEPLAADAGKLVGKVFRSVQIDSWEIFPPPNWSNCFLDAFKKYRGYDPRPYLPALAGRVVGSAEVTGRFLYDYRNTIGDCVADHYFGRLGQLAAAKGLIQQSEAGGPVPGTLPAMDCLKNLGRCDIPMGEFWQDGSWVEANQNVNGKQTASAAHLYGKRIAAAEAFTSFVHWVNSPAALKPTADRAVL